MLRVFVASSSEARPLMELISAELQDLGKSLVEVTPWTIAFSPGDIVISRLQEIAELFDFFVIIQSPDDRLFSRGRKKDAPRDNVVFELGLFIGAAGLERALCVRPADPALQLFSDFQGVNYLEYVVSASGMPSPGELRRLSVSLHGHFGNVGPKKDLKVIQSWGFGRKQRAFGVALSPSRLQLLRDRSSQLVLGVYRGNATGYLDVACVWSSGLRLDDIAQSELERSIFVDCSSIAQKVRKGDRFCGILMLIPSTFAPTDGMTARDVMSAGGRVVDGKGCSVG